MATASLVSLAHNTVTAEIQTRYGAPDQGTVTFPAFLSPASGPEALIGDEDAENDSADLHIRIEGSNDDDSDAESCAEYVPHPEMTTKEYSSSRVTFRSRVRITSGISRHNRSPHRQSYSIPGLTPDSSRSCSPSSSISAPLRFHSEEPTPKPGWGTLGQRVSLLARRNSERRNPRTRQSRLNRSLSESCLAMTQSSETTPLLAGSGLRNTGQSVCSCNRCEAEEQARSQQSHSTTTTPSRFFDIYWWWNYLTHYTTCRCLDDSDEE